jgi:hypothetical protein
MCLCSNVSNKQENGPVVNHPGHPYVQEKLATFQEQALARRAAIRFALEPRPAGRTAVGRRAVATGLRRLADRLEPHRPGSSRLPQPGR